MGFFKSGRGGSVKGRVYRKDACPTCGAEIGRNAMHAHTKKHEQESTSKVSPKASTSKSSVRQTPRTDTWNCPSAETRPELYECVDCSQKPGAPTLCARCLSARAAAGNAWA